MADDQDTSAKGDNDDKKDPPDQLGDPDKKALEAERKARREAERQLKQFQDRLKELEDKDKSEAQRLTEKVAAAEARAEEAQARLLRLEVGHAKGLTAAQARRLVGVTPEELEADADDLLASFRLVDDKPDAGARPPTRPTEKLRGGGDPTEAPEPDMRKVVEGIPRW